MIIYIGINSCKALCFQQPFCIQQVIGSKIGNFHSHIDRIRDLCAACNRLLGFHYYYTICCFGAIGSSSRRIF